eukprot:gene408-119_t
MGWEVCPRDGKDASKDAFCTNERCEHFLTKMHICAQCGQEAKCPKCNSPIKIVDVAELTREFECLVIVPIERAAPAAPKRNYLAIADGPEAAAPPAEFVPRQYQKDCFDHACRENTIVHLDTGMGKTLIASMTIDYFLDRAREERKHVIFIAPTIEVVKQQAKYIRKHCKSARATIALYGTKMEQVGAAKWNEFLVYPRTILVGTPEVFRRAMVQEKYIRPEQFCLMVFDECHHATGNSPEANIMKHAIHPIAGDPDCPRILGLTASFIQGKMCNPQLELL